MPKFKYLEAIAFRADTRAPDLIFPVGFRNKHEPKYRLREALETGLDKLVIKTPKSKRVFSIKANFTGEPTEIELRAWLGNLDPSLMLSESAPHTSDWRTS